MQKLSTAERLALLKLARATASAGDSAALPPIEPADRGGTLPLSFAQQRLWFLEQLGSAGTAYHVSTRVRLKGALDRDALARALGRIVSRHEALRTTFEAPDGEPRQRIAPAEESAFPLAEEDLSHEGEAGLRRVASGESALPFDLERGPLVRGRLVRLGADDHVLLLTLHHIVSDGWSMGVLARELGALYAAFRAGEPDPLPPLPVQYADYAAWQRRRMDGELLARQAEYWRSALAGAPELLELPADRPRPTRQDFAGSSFRLALGEALTARLKELSRRHGTTLFMTVLAGWAAVLSRLSGQNDVVVGTPAANRDRGEVEGLIGFFVNTLALRVDLAGSPPAAELLARVRARALGAQEHREIPFEQVVELVRPARTLAHSPLFQVMLAWQSAPREALAMPGLAQAPAAAAPAVTAKFDLLLALSESGGRIAGTVEYATALFERATVERWAGYLPRVLEGMAADDARPVDRIPILSEAERDLVVRGWNRTEARYPRDRCVHELFEARVERAPGAVALVFEGERLTYAQLNARANRLAHHLRSLGVGPDGRVGICVERSVEMVVGLLGILKAGGAYVPLDASYPVERLRNMVEDSVPAVLLTHPPLADTAAALAAGSDLPVIDLADDAAWAHLPETNLGRGGVTPGSLGHVLFTSGSTGRPKGVMLEHGSLLNRLAWMQDRYGMTADEVLLQKTPFSFDVSFCEFFWPLMVGARVVLARPGGHREPAYLADLIQREGITHAHFVPSMLQLFLEHPDASKCTGLLRVPVSGEAVSAALVRHFHERLPGVELTNQYGPTESGEVTEWRCDPDAERVSIGRAIHNSTVYVLDRAGQPAPVGVAGELFIGGIAVARGYLGRPALTAERFVPDAFGAPGARAYRTGDLCRWTEFTDALTHSRTHALEYLGRTDFQVKVRGFRVELGEIEARLAVHPAVREAVVLALDDGAGGTRLAAYYTADAPVRADALRAHLAEALPEFMIPAALVWMAEFPVTPNGKLDRRALPAPEADAFAASRGYEAPLGETEEALAAIWSELLGVERVGRRDDFFALGGHSLRAVQVVSRVRQSLGVEAEVGDLFVRPVLADFARALAAAHRVQLPPITPADRGSPLPLSFAQQRLWFMDRMEGTGSAYHVPARMRLKGGLDRDALVRALDRIVERHEALRTTFPERDGVAEQRIAPAGESRFPLAEHDFSGRADAGRELARLAAEETRAPFDLARGPLIRGMLARMAEDDHVLLVTMHHVVSDGWSMGVLTRELGSLYAAFRAGEPDPLPPLPVQYADYAAWQRRWMEGEVLKAQAEYWKAALGGAPELLELPTDRARPARRDYAGAAVSLVLDEGLSAGLKELGRRHGTTLFMTLLAGWAAVLGRLSGQDDVVVGTPTANRGRQEIEGLIGFFVNMLAVRVELSGAPSVSELLARARERALGAQHHQDIPFEQVVELVRPARSLAHAPLFQAMFTWQNAPGGGPELPGLTLAPIGPGAPGPAGPSPAPAPAQATANVDLSLTLSERGGRIAGSLTYATALFDRETVERWVGYLRRVLEEMAADDGRRVDALPLLPDAERRLVVEEWSRAEAVDPGESCIHQLFEAWAERAPDAAAVVFGEDRLTYAELNAAANRLARRLRAAGVGPERPVGVMLERSAGLAAALLAVLKAGGAYLPLDPALPAARRAALLADAGASVLVTRDPGLEGFAGTIISPTDVEGEDDGNLRLDLPPAALAYVIHTSGSTGTPKGVGVAHAAAAAHCRAAVAAYGLTPADRVLQFAAIGFDVSLEQMLAPLSAGACVVLRGREVPTPLEFARRVEEEGLTVVNPPTAYWHQLVAEPAALEILARTVRLVIAGGEAMSPAAAREWAAGPAAGVRLLNGYGPTEAVVTCTAYDVPPSPPDGAVHVPVGRPLAGRAAYVLEGWSEPSPPGVPGELCIGGILARGYLGRPAATAAAFVPDPFSATPGARMYRTGDRARWLPAGVLEFLGRRDRQVKVRGFRIEPGEIEARLAEHPGVREAAVLAREDAPGEKRLVAYVSGDAADAEALRAHLAAHLPEYMVPAAYVRLERLPLTPNGKVDRRALPAPEGGAYAARGYEAPVSETEQALAEIWTEVLGVERVGRHDHFFELGGHSLLAVRVISRARQVLEVEASLGDLFLRPVLGDFARALETAARAELPPIGRASRAGRVPLSFAQQRLWFLEQMGSLGGTYHIPTRLRLRGALDRAALRRALDGIVARHEALRTTFAEVDGVPEQRIAPVETSAFELVEHDLRGHPRAGAELRRVMTEEADAPFDLERGPLIRGRLVHRAEDDHVLLLTMHHLVSDGWSMEVLTRELGALYAAHREGRDADLPELPVQYADYAVWQRRWVEGEVLREQADYWTRTLTGAPELLELPADHPRPARQDYAGAAVSLVLDEGLSAGLKELGRRHGTTLFMTLLAGWAAVLGRLSGQEDVVVGTPTANRGRREIEGLIGFFVNTLALRVDLSDAPTVADLLARVKKRALEAQHHQDIPFEQVVELIDPARTLAHHPLFQVLLAWQSAHGEGEASLPGMEPGGAGGAAAGASRAQAKFDLSLALTEREGRIVGGLTYATSLFERETVERWVGYLRRVLEEMVADDGRRVGALPLLADAERRLVVEEWNRTAADYPAGSCIHELFEAQVERTPGAAAVVFEEEEISYAELNRRANRLAHHLRALGVGPDARVGLCLERGVQAIVGVLAALKAGGAYLPLDPSHPVERLREMLADGRPAVLLTQASLLERVGALRVPVVALDADAAAWADRPEGNPARQGLTPEHLAYVVYTSGSTGRPKGVMVRHVSVVNLASALQARIYAAHPAPLRVGVSAPLVFDGSVKQIVQLLAGHALCPVPDAVRRDPAALVAWLRRERVDALDMTPALLRLALAEGLGRDGGFPRLVLVGGEAVDEELRERMSRVSTRFYNVYGPTECTVDATAREVAAAGPAAAIGGPLPNVSAYVVEPGHLPAPVGVAGELYVGGAGVARGYLDRPAITAERFVPDPFSATPGARLYRTGDRARWMADGTLEYLGRLDAQVKVRGFRIEPGEIEARLAEHPGVREAAVLAREDAPGEKRLVAYVSGDETASSEALRAHLGATLPEYMVPAAYVRLERLPLTPNGKVDRKALPAPEGGAYAARGYEAPVSETEQALAEIWAEVLGVERVGRHDHFFELGGHSLLAVRVISRARQVLEVAVSLGDLFLRPVLGDFARALETAARAELPPIGRASRAGRVPLSFAQQRLWFLEQMGSLGGTYHIPTRLRLRGALDRAALRRALDGTVARHEALRTTFAEVDGVPEQRIAPVETSAFELVEHDLRGHPRAGAELRRVMTEEADAPFDLERGPLIRGRLVRRAEDDHVLLLTMHHIVSDGWSMGVLTRELGALYAAHREGRDADLPELPVQYADYAVWQRRWVEGEVLREQADYWTRTLTGAPELLELPADHPRPARQDYAGATVSLVLDEGLSAGLKALGRRHGTTLFMTLLAAWAAVLGRLSGQDDVVIGTPTANRGRREIEGLIGFFVNTLALRVDLSDAPTVTDLLARVKKRALEAQHHQDIPFEQVVELIDPARTLAHHPLFQVLLAWQNAHEDGEASLAGLEAGGAGGAGGAAAGSSRAQAKFDLSLALTEREGRIVGGLTYATSLFERETVERWAGYLRRVLEEMAADDGRRVGTLPLLADAERRLVEEWSRAEAVGPGGSCIHQLFEARVERAPGAPAVVFQGEETSYAELNAAANRLARRLRAAGVGPERLVGVMLERSAGLVAALLAVLKAGGAYLPLDPALPAARRAALLADAGAAVLVTLGPGLEGFAGTIISLADAEGEDEGDLRLDLPPAALAYVIYTSGSTGAPKGVGVAHAEAAAHCRAVAAAYGLTPADRVLQFAAIGFDVSLEQMLAPLSTGACVVLKGREVPTPLELARRAEEEGLTVVNPPTAYWHQLVAEPAALEILARTVRLVIAGGEAMSPAAAREWAAGPAAGVRLLNGYGPTEAVVTCTAYEVPPSLPDGAVHVPVGRPLAGRAAYVLDGWSEPAPPGVPGELCIGGILARGYLGRPAATAAAFVPDPFSATPGARMYRTGDRARWLAAGELEFLGRRDHQVKVRGFRIEPGEIEARLAEHPDVREAVVLARGDAPGDTRLVAYVVGEAASSEALRAHLGETLPAYMVPAAIVRMEELPLTPNGKVDRAALPAPEAEPRAAGAYEAPVGETEQALAAIWAEVLGVERVGRQDNFFELGGHSLLAVRAISRVRQALEVEVAVAHVFSHPTVESLAARLGGSERRVGSGRAIAIRPSGSRPPLFLIHDGTGSIAYAQVLHPHVDADVPVYALPAAPSSEPPLRTIEGMAARLVGMMREVQPSGPYRLAGWSFGGVLAYEVATQLIGQDEAVELVGMFDSGCPVSSTPAASPDPRREHAFVLHVLRTADTTADGARAESDEAVAAAGDADLETFVRTCRDEGLLPRHVTVAQSLEVRDRLRRHQRAWDEYRPQPIPAPVHQFPSRESASRDPSRGWGALLSDGRLRVTPVPGTHFSMMRAPNAASLGQALSRALAGAGESGRAPPGEGSPPLRKLRHGAAGVAPLFCVPGAGTSVASFMDLLGSLDPSWPVHGFQPRGLDGAAVPHSTVEAAAEHYLRAVGEAWPRGPVHLLGHSFGGWVAFEMALRLRRAGRAVASLTILDSEAPDEPGALIREATAREAFFRLVEVLELTAERPLGIGAADVEPWEEREWLKALHRRMVQHGLMTARSTPEVLDGPFRTFARCMRTTYRPSGVHPGRLRLVLVDDPRKAREANLAGAAEVARGWRRWAPALELSAGAGNHATALKPPHVATLAGYLAADREMEAIGSAPG